MNLSQFDLHLEQYNKSFTTKSFKLSKEAKIYTYEQRKVTECEDYEEFSKGACDSRANCVEICYNMKFLEKYHALPRRNSLVYPAAYPEHDQRILFFFHEEQEDEQIWRNCSAQYEKPNCKTFEFYHVFGPDKHNSRDNSSQNSNQNEVHSELAIDPFFFQVKQGNRLNFNSFQMICSLITLSTIISGLNWPRASNTTIRLVNYFLKEDDRLNLKHLFFLISFLGFFAHASFIFYQTCFTEPEINSRIEYDYSKSNRKIPDLVLCVKHNLSLSDQGFAGFKNNEQQTGQHLEEKTRWLNESYLFREIVFFDSNMNKKVWLPSEQQPGNLIINKWFMHEFKCFTLVYRVNQQSFKNYVINTILKLNFNSELARQNRSFLFSSKETETNDFSHNYLLNFKAVTRVQYIYYHTYDYDQYQSLANPRLLFNSGHKINVGI